MNFKEVFKPNKTNILLTIVLFVILSSFLPIIPVSYSKTISLPFSPSIIPTTSIKEYSTLLKVIKNYKDVKSIQIISVMFEILFVFLICSLSVFYYNNKRREAKPI